MSKNAITLNLYRILLKEIRGLSKLQQDQIIPVLQRTLDPREYGHAHLFDIPRQTTYPNSRCISRENDILKLFDYLTMQREERDEDNNEAKSMPSLGPESSLTGVTPKLLESSVKRGFRSNQNIDSTIAQSKAISAIRELNTQIELWKQTSVYIDKERNIACMATGSCIGRTSENISNGRFFAYRIRIENRNNPDTSDTTVQLLGRHWKIYDAEKKLLNTVDAPTTGAVGYHPVLHPGQGFEYMSGTEITSETGQMEGSFDMAVVEKGTKSARVGDDLDAFEVKNNHFELQVAPFQLIS